MRDIAICLAVLALLAGCGGSSHRKSGPQSTSPQEQPKGTGGLGPTGGTTGGPAQIVAEVPYPQTAADCVRQLEAQARAARVRFTVRETRPKGQGFTCVADIQR
jgi:hypothetical protein